MPAFFGIVGSVGFGAYFRYSGHGFLWNLILAIWFAGLTVWFNRDLLKRTREEAYGFGARVTFRSWGTWVAPLLIFLLFVAVSLALQWLGSLGGAILRH